VKLSLNRLDKDKPAWMGKDLDEKLRLGAAAVGEPGGRVDLVLVDDSYIRKINREFRNVDAETDVISFAYGGEEQAIPCEDDVSGEVYISYETIEKEANERGVDAGDLLLRTVLHGLLHIIGYDHRTESEAALMEAEERRILIQLLAGKEVDALFS
jgi:probable rRNA maturation factor